MNKFVDFGNTPMRIAHSRVWALFAAVILCGPHAGIASDADAGLIAAVASNYERYRSIPSLRIEYELKYDLLSKERNYIFTRAIVKTARKGNKVRLDLDADVFNGTKMRRSYAWDGATATGVHWTGADSGEYFLSSTKNSNMFYYNEYMDFLCYPDATGSVPSPARAAGMEYLPRMLVNSPPSATSVREVFEDTECIKLEKSGHYKFWFDPALGHMPRRWDTFDPVSGGLRWSTALSDFRQIAGVWLPARISREERETRGRSSVQAGALLWRKVINVTTFSTLDIPDAEFRIAPPKGAKIHDEMRKESYTYFGDDRNRVVESAEQLRQLARPPGRSWWLTPLASILGLAIVALLLAPRILSRQNRR